MPNVPHVIQIRHRRQGRARRSPAPRAARLGLIFGAILSLFVALLFIVLTIAYAAITQDLPSPDALPLLLEPPDGLFLQPTRLYDRTGEHVILTLENPAAADRQYLAVPPAPSLSSALISAHVAVSDPTFWTNPGYSFDGLRQGSHPTIAQRLVSDLLLWDEPPSLRRALRERLLAAQVTARFGRAKVLEWYLNSADYGNLAYGVDAAARLYLGKSATELTLSEAALLAAITEAPALNPHHAPQVARERQEQALQSMLDQNLITAEAYQQAVLAELVFQPPSDPPNLAPAFVQLVLQELEEQFPLARLRRGGLQIVTTLDYELQTQAACAVEMQLRRLSGDAANENPAADGSPCLAARLLPTISTTGEKQELAAEVILLDPTAGQLLALVGESSTLPTHPPGSLLTPFIYLTAFTRGFSPASLVWDIPANIPDSFIELGNPDGQFHGPLRLRTAMANDYFVPAANLLTQLGAQNVWRIARQVGVHSLTETGELFPFAGGEATLLEISQAYGVFANQGLAVGRANSSHLPPLTVLEVRSLQGAIWFEANDLPATKAVISAPLAYLITHMLSDEPARWPSLGHPNPLEIGRPAGAKIGRTLDGGDAWTVGYTPRLVAGVWLGSRAPQGKASPPPNGAAGLWHAIMQYASRHQPLEGWKLPSGVTTVEVCDPSGMLPTPQCPQVVGEVFLPGSEPTHPDTLYRAFHINRESGNLATVFTPPALIEESVFMVVPPEAADWAQSVGLSTPPETYDGLKISSTDTANARIFAPEMFANVRGRVAIVGRAAGPAFAYYRLQVGQGLNPQNWLQVSADVPEAVENGQLAVWDTSSLSGLFALQLLVVDQAQRVEAVTIQLTVDNSPPEVAIRYPSEGQRFVYPQESEIAFQVDAADELNLAAVEFYLDGKLLATRRAAPFVVPWQGRIGQHTLRVRAVDLAGNSAEDSLTFEIGR